MKNRMTFSASRKNCFVWLSALLMIASAIGYIAFRGKGAEGKTVWLTVVLPVFGCLTYVLTLLLDGQERLYRTAVPAVLLAISYAAGIQSSSVRMIFLFWVTCLAIAAFYTVTVSGRLHSTLWMILLLLAVIAVYIFTYRALYRQPAVYVRLSMLLGGLFAVLAMKPNLDVAYHPTWGDRPDGRRLRTLDPITVVAIYVMPNRNGASNSIRDSVEITAMEHYIREKRKQGMTNFGITHVFLAAYVRCVAKYPAINRFLSGQRVYSRGDDIQFCMVVKADMTTDGEESIAKLHLKPTDTAADVYEKLNAEVERIKSQPVGSSEFDKTAKLLSFIPGVAFKFVIWLLKLMDYFGLIPKELLEVSPFHASIFFTSMGSLGIPPVVHHLYDFGNLPVFCSFGCKQRTREILDDGIVVARKYVDYTMNTDERIVDGFYFATVNKYLKKLLTHPEQLDQPPEEVRSDID